MNEDRLSLLCPHLAGKRILVMPGHVNNNWGVRALAVQGVGCYQSENEITLDVAAEVYRLLGYTGAKYRLVSGGWERKWNIAKRFEPDYTVELHGNAPGANTPNRWDIRGIEAWVGKDQESRYAAALVIKRVREATDLPVHGDYPGEANDGLHLAYAEGNKRRALFERVQVPKGTPLVLFEMGFLTNAKDAAALTSHTVQRRIALGLVMAMEDWFHERGT